MLDKRKVEIFIAEALKYDGDRYSQPKRLQKGFSDCSSLIQKPLNTLGWNTRPGVAVTTHRMGVEGDSRFRRIDMSELERGDLVWYRNDKNGKYFGHVGIYLGNNKVFEAIYAGISTYPLSRIRWQRAYRVVALETKNNARPEVTTFNAIGVVRAAILNVRSSNTVNSDKLGQLKKAQKINIIGKADSWFEIEYKGGKAFVSGAYVDLINDKPIENIPIVLNGNVIKKGYIIDGTTYMVVNGKEKAVRQSFESMGAKVEWRENKVQIIM